MKFSKTIRRQIRHAKDGVNVAADVNAAVTGSVNEPGTRTSVSTRQTVVQRDGRTTSTTTKRETHRDERQDP